MVNITEGWLELRDSQFYSAFSSKCVLDQYKMPSTVCTYCRTVAGTVYIQCTPSSTIELWYLNPLCNQLITFPDKLWLPEFKVSSSVSQQSGSEANMETERASASAIALYSSRSQMW